VAHPLTDGSENIIDAARDLRLAGDSAPRQARDPVNQPMINNWVEALGDTNPIYTDPEFAATTVHGGIVAPPAMAQVWTMPGLHGQRTSDDPLGAMIRILDEAGFTSVVATNCEQTYHRYVRPGEQISVTARLHDLVGPKRTGLGEGWFVTTLSTWYVGKEPVAEMLFRVLKFRPAEKKPEPAPGIKPLISRDTEFFWEGTAAGELRVQRCEDCGALRHPPGPMCPKCGGERPGFVVSSGNGEVYSYVVHHHPKVPGKELPFVVALVELDEGVRMLGELLDVSTEDVRVGLPVQVSFTDQEPALPAWRVRESA
jgi:uncharacterized OB-fold protein/acyl dehydratase